MQNRHGFLRAFVVADDLNPRIMDADPNLFFVTGIGGSGMIDESTRKVRKTVAKLKCCNYDLCDHCG